MNTLSNCLQENLTRPVNTIICSFPDCPIVRQKDSVIDHLTAQIEQIQKEKQQLAEDNERLRALLNKRNSTIFGRSSEKKPAAQSDQQTDGRDSANDRAPDQGKKRGARFGHKGHGRKIPNIPEVEVFHKIPDDQLYCPICRKRRKITNLYWQAISLRSACSREERGEVSFCRAFYRGGRAIRPYEGYW